MSGALSLIKISGHYLDDEVLLQRFAAAVKLRVALCAGKQAESAPPQKDAQSPDLPSRERLVIVHGGGIEITRLQERLNIEPKYTQGLRITDAESLSLVEMTLCGSVNKRLVRHLLNAGVDALGMSGVDRGLLRARQMKHETVDMQYTGEVEAVRGELLLELLQLGLTPVIAPVCAGIASNFNLNADTVSGALAPAIGADSVVYISNVPGVLLEGELVTSLHAAQARALIADGAIFGGMIPKVNSALDLLSSGVAKAIITDLAGWARGAGTTLMK